MPKTKLPYDIYLLGKVEALRRKRARVEQGIADMQANAGSAATTLQGYLDGKNTLSGNKYKGSGMYTGMGGFFNNVRRAGRLLGPRILGALENRAVGAISGSGAYNCLFPQDSDLAPATITYDDQGNLVLTHTEFVSDIYGPASTAFTNQTFACNPGVARSFPFASQLAANFEEYQFLQLIYDYKSTTTDIGSSTNGVCGTIEMCPNYNPSNGVFRDKSTMMGYSGSQSAKTTEPLTCGVECDPAKRPGADSLWVRCFPIGISPASGNNEDLKLYDHCTMNVAINNSPSGFANQSIGELWVSYKILLRKPRFWVNRGFTIMRDLYVQSVTNVTNTSYPLGQQAAGQLIKAQRSNMDLLVTTPSANNIVLTWPAAFSGLVKVQMYFETPAGVTFSAGLVAPTPGGNVVQALDMYALQTVAGDSPSNGVSLFAGGQGLFEWHGRVNIATGGVNNTLTLVCTATLSAGTTYEQCVLDVSQYNNFDFNYGSDAPIFINVQSGVVTTV